MKLKTLKDFRKIGIAHKGHFRKRDIPKLMDELYNEIKVEAIKWVKEARKFEDECVDREDFRTAKFHGGYARGLTTFINIKEEDLK